jgi:hypothetical protein
VREVTQTILADQIPGVPGNCLQAAVASLLELDLDDVPHFITHDDWLQHLVNWGREHGYLVISRPDDAVHMGIACGQSERGHQHAVVLIDGQIAWDPHPSRAGLVSISWAMSWEPLEPQP